MIYGQQIEMFFNGEWVPALYIGEQDMRIQVTRAADLTESFVVEQVLKDQIREPVIEAGQLVLCTTAAGTECLGIYVSPGQVRLSFSTQIRHFASIRPLTPAETLQVKL